ncbi:MAG: CoA-acylating methylmalonate-semialdehyde dehydrogenase [Deltaproteobacteria bacterium]|nr:MAG: CoA-acylating methylmalonate-semialdehyde dehydrogenase [Deltaproteobacteria bacterium]
MAIDSYDFQTIDPILNWIGGEYRASSTGNTMDVINPRHGKVMTSVVLSGADDVQAAVDAASAAYPAWKETPLKERAQVMYRLKYLMERDQEKIAWLISHENGKVFNEAMAEVAKGIECTEFGCALPNIPLGETLYVSRGVTCSTIREPLGVCAGVTPFNFPFMVPLWMLPQALVAGNTFILKPSEQVPIGADLLAQLLQEAGLPPGVFNVVHGARDAVEALSDHETIKAMGFVGSTRVAKIVYGRGAQTGRRMLCLGGAKNHLIVVPDADREMTAVDVVRSFTGVAGQRCMAASALMGVQGFDPILETIVEKASQLVPGRDMGPVINKQSYERILGYIKAAEEAGGKVLLDGRNAKVEGAEGGYWIGPTILEVTKDMPAYQDEIFGPVLSVVRTKSLDEALAIENAHVYGNGGSIYTTSGATARYAAQRINAGMTGVNIGVPVPREPFGFGGWEHSKFGSGDITGIDGYHYWTRPRKLTTKWALQPDATWMS